MNVHFKTSVDIDHLSFGKQNRRCSHCLRVQTNNKNEIYNYLYAIL